MSICGLDVDESKLCILHKDQMIIFSVNNQIYYASMKMIYKTFHGKDIKVFTAEKEWATAQIVGRPCTENLICINNSIICTEDALVLCEHEFIPARCISRLDKVRMVHDQHWSGPAFYSDDRFVDVGSISNVEPAEDEWLFGLKFFGPDSAYTLKNGMIVSAVQ